MRVYSMALPKLGLNRLRTCSGMPEQLSMVCPFWFSPHEWLWSFLVGRQPRECFFFFFKTAQRAHSKASLSSKPSFLILVCFFFKKRTSSLKGPAQLLSSASSNSSRAHHTYRSDSKGPDRINNSTLLSEEWLRGHRPEGKHTPTLPSSLSLTPSLSLSLSPVDWNSSHKGR